MLLGEFQAKDVVNVVDGSKLGKVSDLEIDTSTGKIISVLVQPSLRFSGFFSNNNTVTIPWNQIIKIGGEVVIVNYTSYLKWVGILYQMPIFRWKRLYKLFILFNKNGIMI